MGFSVSGAMAVILIGVFVAIAMAFPAAMAGIESIADAHSHQEDQLKSWHNADVELVNATYDDASETLSVNTTNAGSESLSVQATHLLADGELVASPERSIAGDTNVTVWLPGETLEVTVEEIDHPDRIKVVTDLGLSVTTEEVETRG